MYSVFLVDDEHIILEGIRSKIDWDNSDFSFAGEASDGELALSMIQEVKPDILITDIKMPFMDGLELAKMVKKIQPWIKIIILSGHDEFDYAKRAISIGVEDYILKPFTHEELLASMKKAALNLDKERKQLSDLSQLKAKLESNQQLVKTKFLSDLVVGKVDSSTCIQKIEELNLDLISRFYKILISDIKNSDGELESIEKCCSSLLAYTDKWNESVSFFMGQNRFVSILRYNSEKEIEDSAYSICEAIEHIVSQEPNCFVISSIGKTVDHLPLISTSYSDAIKFLENTQFFNKSRIINSDDITHTDDGQLSLKENDPLVDRLKYARQDEIEEIIGEYISLLQNNSNQFTVIASYLLVDVIMAVSKLIENLGGNIQEVMPRILKHSFVENAVADKRIFINEVRQILTEVMEYRDSHIQGKYGDVILKAKEYINKNYGSLDTHLTSVAEQVNLSPNHFSTIFSQECGMTFIEYLTNIRIENAKKLLKETEMKGADIAYECGFNNPHYFSFIFKKITGLTPSEYKAGLGNNSEN
ncbi:MAG: response regulator [Treponema sp.]|nr:response regulator [Treponema sp.]MDY5122754.1 response regulator [Treponema sp.]